MKKILFVLLFAFTLLSCDEVVISDLEKDVREAIVADFRSNPDCYGVRVGDVSLVHEDGKRYVGIVELSYDGGTYQHELEVILDGDEFIWYVY